MFTQDIYSYIANGNIVRQGLDPYSGGPVDILGSSNELARSVPFIWAHSPSPYGPVSLGLAAVISTITNDHIALAVLGHRILSLLGIIACAWALVHLSRRCKVAPQAALWLGVLNPLTILHLVAGIHNESVLLGLLLVGLELGLRGVDRINLHGFDRASWWWIGVSGFLISCAGMVKVTGFIGLGFTGMAIARAIYHRRQRRAANKCTFRSSALPVVQAAFIQIIILLISVAVVTLATGIGLGWITGQGGAVTIRSWMSLSTSVGVIAGAISMMLGLGDHTEAILSITRLAILALAGAFMIRMLLGTYRGTISAIGGLGVATFILVLCFPVVHPWYALWAILPLSAWANRSIFRITVTVYSTIISFFVLPRGLGLPPATIASIYVGSAIAFAIIVAIAWVARNRSNITRIN
jgi:alpha-1,6-mannosyltransferase